MHCLDAKEKTLKNLRFRRVINCQFQVPDLTKRNPFTRDEPNDFRQIIVAEGECIAVFGRYLYDIYDALTILELAQSL